MIAAGLILAILIAFAVAVFAPNDGEAPVFFVAVLALAIIGAMSWEAGERSAIDDYTTGKITIEKIPVVTKEIR